MHNIKYVTDFDQPMSSKNKSPWITINGEDIADSQLAMEYLAKKFDLETEQGLSDKDKAISRSMRFMLEQDLYWTLVCDRWIYNKGRQCPDIFAPMTGSKTVDRFIFGMFSGMVKKQAIAQGMGRHARPEVEKMGTEDLNALSTFLGNKKYMMGDQPTELDCTMFGFMCMFLFCTPKDNIYVQKIERDLTNLCQYTDRMIQMYWPDWKDARYKA